MICSTTRRSPQKSCHNIAIALDSYERSPLYGRIKRLGTATPGRKGETLTQATVVESLMNYISDEPGQDRDTFIRKLFPRKATGSERKRLIFRNLFLEENDSDIAEILLQYFLAVQEKWPEAWDNPQWQGNILPKTNGFKGLMRFLRDAYLSIVGDEIGKVPSKAEFFSVFSRAPIQDYDFDITNFPPGTSGERTLYDWLKRTTLPETPKQNSLNLWP